MNQCKNIAESEIHAYSFICPFKKCLHKTTYRANLCILVSFYCKTINLYCHAGNFPSRLMKRERLQQKRFVRNRNKWGPCFTSIRTRSVVQTNSSHSPAVCAHVCISTWLGITKFYCILKWKINEDPRWWNKDNDPLFCFVMVHNSSSLN